MPDKDKALRRARAAAAEFGEAAREHAETTFESVIDAAEDGADEAHRFLRKQWRERPIIVAASAFGIGLLVGMALTGRR